MSGNKERLGNVLAGRMRKQADAAVPVEVELGTINSDLTLTTDSLPGRIQPQEYLVDIRLTHANYKTGSTTVDGYSHQHSLPSVFRKLKGGDRVLVLWAGNDPVVVAIVAAGNTNKD